MLLTCPACAARYEIADHRIPAGGKRVRCAACGHVWHNNAAVSPEPEPVAESAPPFARGGLPPERVFSSVSFYMDPAADPAATTPGAADMPAAGLPPADPPSSDQPSSDPPQAGDAWPREPESDSLWAPAPAFDPWEPEARDAAAAARGRARMAALAVWILAAALLAGAVASAWVWRDDIVRHWPRAGAIYDRLGVPARPHGLAVESVTAEPGPDGLAVGGRIVGLRPDPVEVPPLHLSAYDAQGRLLKVWLAPPPAERLGRGQSVVFRSRLAASDWGARPPPARVHVRFAAPPAAGPEAGPPATPPS